jgi:hypothetical protein
LYVMCACRVFGAPQCFRSPEEAWFWACMALRARREGVRGAGDGITRPCDPDDILLCVERLLQTKQLDLVQARVLGLWGLQQMVPTAASTRHGEAKLWQNAMAVLATALIKKGLVAD